MARDEVDLSLITNEGRKQKMTSYITNEDNVSADKDETVKRLKETVNPLSTALSGQNHFMMVKAHHLLTS
jgi:hypothetical protein